MDIILDENFEEDSKCGADVFFKGVTCIERKNPQITFSVKDCINNVYVDVNIPRTAMEPSNVERAIAINNGVCEDAKSICRNLLKRYNSALKDGTLHIRYLHTRLGWHIVDNETVFYGDSIVCKDNAVISSYCGNIDVKPVGDIMNVINMIKNKIIGVQGWSKLEAVIAFGVGAIVLAYANIEWNTSFNNILLHLVGGSTTGKSTALILFSGLGCNPDPKLGFWISHASTEGSIIKRIGNNNGYPVAIDEISAGTRKEYDSFVYTIGNGEEKDRLKPGGIGLQDSVTFQTAVLSSGEVSLLKKCSKNEGIRARCIEFANVYWTESKQQSIAIKECMKSNHGLVAPMVAKELIANGDKWKERWEFWRKKVDAKISKDKICLSIGGRVADYVALFTLAAEIANVVLDIELNVNEIFKFCYEYIIIANEEEANLAVRAYSAIVEYISRNRDRFADATFFGGSRSMYDDVTLDTNQDGFYHNVRRKTINGNVYDMVYVFRMGAMENILADAGFADAKVSLFKLREAGYLKTKDNNRNTYSYTINGSTQKCIAVYFRDETMDGCSFDDGRINPFMAL
ncbi:MAG: DUF927 domain-containing protein [Lachnospiraceae bacterium]|nr:DUF927 domain-containing protein [Lachnospiraceae bacterium]